MTSPARVSHVRCRCSERWHSRSTSSGGADIRRALPGFAFTKIHAWSEAVCVIVTAVRALVLVAVLAPTIASADPFHGSSWYEGGVVRTRIDTGGSSLVEGYAVRFSPRVAVASHLYIGGELDTGTLDGQVATPATYRTTGGGEMTPMTAATGRLGAVRFVA